MTHNLGKKSVGGLLGAFAAVTCFTNPIYANPIYAQTTQSETSNSASPTIEKVIVTAERRSENVQKVPIAITVISPQKIQDLGIVTTQDIQLVTPGMTFESGYGFSQPYIRGIGTTQPNPGLESAVASYVDDAYIVRSYGQIDPLFDMSSVQVLKGAQGTLWGQNATGGAILYTTAPAVLNEYSADATAEFGNYQHALGELVVNIPLGDTLALRVGDQDSWDQGYITNVVNGSKWGGGSHQLARATLNWQPTSDFSASVMYENYRDVRYVNTFAERAPSPGCGSCALPGGNYNPVPGFYQIASNSGATPTVATAQTTIIHLDYKTNTFDVNSVSSFRIDKTSGVINVAGSSIPYENYYAGSGGHTWAEDLQVVSKLDGMVNGMAGLSLMRDTSILDARITGALVLNTPGITSLNTVITHSYSGFGELYVTPIDRLKFTFGLRYTDDNRVFSGIDSQIAEDFFGNPSNLTPTGKGSFSELTPRFVADYDFGLVNVYVSYNRGFKEGGFNTPSFTNEVPVKPETVDYYEGGAKYVSGDGRLKLDASVFYYRYRNIQVSTINLASGTNILQNAASARGYGSELDGSYDATDWLNVFANISLLNADFTQYPNASITDVTAGGIVGSTENLANTTLPSAPHFQTSLGFDIHAPIENDLLLQLNAVERYTSSYDFYPGAGGPAGYARQGDYGVLNISGYVEKDVNNAGQSGFSPSYYRLGFFVNNATGTKYASLRTEQAYIGQLEVVAPPLMYGLRLSVGF